MNVDQHLLLKLIEECAEVQHRAAKMMQFGPNEIEPGQPLTNGARLRLEIMDMIVIHEMLKEAGQVEGLTWTEVDAHSAVKRAKITKYLDLSRSLGMVTP